MVSSQGAFSFPRVSLALPVGIGGCCFHGSFGLFRMNLERAPWFTLNGKLQKNAIPFLNELIMSGRRQYIPALSTLLLIPETHDLPSTCAHTCWGSLYPARQSHKRYELLSQGRGHQLSVVLSFGVCHLCYLSLWIET